MRNRLRAILHLDVRLPVPVRALVRVLYRGGIVIREALDSLYATLIVKPVMQAITQCGRRLRIERIPYIRGNGRIDIGDDVYISGLLGVSFLQREEILTTEGTENTERDGESTVFSLQSSISPILKIGSRSFVGHQCSFALSRSVEIGEDCMIAAGTKIQDNDGHPLDPDARRHRERVALGDIRPVRIGNNVWIAPRCTILKGVTIGDNAVVATGSVVTKDVPANTLVAGVPARVVRRLAEDE